MRVICRNGFFSFYPERSSDVTEFCSYFEIDLVRMEDFYTFPILAEIPNYSIQGAPLSNLVANKTYEGKPWEVLRENRMVYSIEGEILVPMISVVDTVDLYLSNFYYIAQAVLIQPGARSRSGKKIVSYDAQMDLAMRKLNIRGYWSE